MTRSTPAASAKAKVFARSRKKAVFLPDNAARFRHYTIRLVIESMQRVQKAGDAPMVGSTRRARGGLLCALLGLVISFTSAAATQRAPDIALGTTGFTAGVKYKTWYNGTGNGVVPTPPDPGTQLGAPTFAA